MNFWIFIFIFLIYIYLYFSSNLRFAMINIVIPKPWCYYKYVFKICNYVGYSCICLFVYQKMWIYSKSLLNSLDTCGTLRSSCNHTILITLSRGSSPILISFLILYYTHSYIFSLITLIVTCGILIVWKFMWLCCIVVYIFRR